MHAGLLLLSPRVEFLVLGAVRDTRETGLFAAALQVFWFLALVPNAVAAGAMPALTREALRGGETVRQRTAATLALLGGPGRRGPRARRPRRSCRAAFGDPYAAAATGCSSWRSARAGLFVNALLAAR